MPKYNYEHIRDGLWLVWQRVQIRDRFLYVRVGYVRKANVFGRPQWQAFDTLDRMVSDKHGTREEAAQAIGIQ